MSLIIKVSRFKYIKMVSPIVLPSQDLKSLPLAGVHALPIDWKQQKALRDTQLSHQKNSKYWILEGKLYDLEEFISTHPGGQSWLRNTKGHDITELFITHHLNEQKARIVLKKYYVRESNRKIKRFTFEQNGLYRTLKRRILQLLTVQQIQNQTQSIKQTFIIFGLFLISVTFTAILSSYIFAALSGILIMGIFGVMHNFLHHKQNPYSKLVRLTGFSFDDFQIMHCISHHIYVNTQLDFQVTGMQPIAYWLRSKPQNKFYTQFIIQPIMALASLMNIIMNLTVFPIKKKRWPNIDYAYPWILWVWMYFLNGDPFQALKLWAFMYIFYSFFFFKVLLCEHRMPELWTEGNERIWDFGQHTVASTSDVNPSVTGMLSYIFLAGFNLHAIHHFFPTADHSILPKLNKVLIEVCKQRNIEYQSMGRVQCALKFTKGMLSRKVYNSKQQ